MIRRHSKPRWKRNRRSSSIFGRAGAALPHARAVMEQVSEELSDRATFVKIDVDDNPDLAREYSIMSIPCVMVFKNGELAGKNVGFGAKAAMKEFIEKYI